MCLRPCFKPIRQFSVKPVPLLQTLCPTASFLPSHVNSWFLWTLPCQNAYCIGTHKATHHHPPPPAGLYIFSQFPPDPDSSWCWGLGGSSLLLRGAQPKGGQGFFFFLKRSKVRFSFLGCFISYGQIRPWCDLFHVSCVCHQQSSLHPSPWKQLPFPFI